jgi:hypothetical protein
MSTTETPPVENEIDKSMPPQDSSETAGGVVFNGKEAVKSSFGDSLGKIAKKSADEKAGVSSEPPASTGEKADPIAAKVAAEKSEAKTADEPKLERKSLKNLLDDKGKPKAEGTEETKVVVSDAEIDEELKNPHKSEKAQKRFLELHRRWKEADAKAVTTAKQSAEKDAKLAELEKKITEAGKNAGVPPEVQAQLDELKQYRRRYQVEKSPEYTKYDVAYKETEKDIADVIKLSGIKFQGMTEEQSIAFIEAEGGFDSFQRKYPKVAKDVREAIAESNPAYNDDLTTAISRQKLIKKAQQVFREGEEKNAVEYFSKMEADEKAKAEAASKVPEMGAVRKKAFDAWRDEAYKKLDFFREEEAPEGASESAVKTVKEKNAFAASLRKTLEENLNVSNDEDFKDIALAATLAHKIKREKDELAARVESLEAELKKIKGAGRTVTKSTQSSAASASAPPKSFTEALDRVQSRRE